ncbi:MULTISPECIES: peptidoglycan DD-metalloendopeptidase family protein [unclassified Sphingomonas]|uniref:peptidoglycan DD-metalloendopeptidase family protein n=1 Tax=unclassified Sphingomonas TaxID=196159 RepID=UPI000B146313|nr:MULTISPECIES: peptidoglycan DD-metalloendopeptidase family protein [unclassified Sphingomonas]
MRFATRSAVAAALMIGASGCIPSNPGRIASRPTVEPAPTAAPGTPPATEPQGDGVTALPSPPPAWEAKRVVPDARSVAPSSYVVRPGDTLRGIANLTGAGTEAIARANNLPPPFMIRAGQRLTIPGGRYHMVGKGESGIAIARAYGVDWSRIATANALTEPFILRAGQRILIPVDAVPRSAAERAAAFQLDIDDILTGGEPAIEPDARPAPAVTSPRRVLPSTAAVAPPSADPGTLIWPVDGRVFKRFGAGDSGERNNGIKIAVPIDTPIAAAAAGTVAYVGTGVPGLGGVVIIRHGSGLTTVYGHASQLLVQRGQAVKKGQKIALSGDTGYAERPAVHFEVRSGRTPVDPLSRLPRR